MENFWNHNYRHEMRTLKPSLQTEVKNVFIEFGIALNGESDLHKELIDSVIGDFTIQGEHPSERLKRIEEAYI